MPVIREVCARGWRIQLDLAAQKLRLDVPEQQVMWRGGRGFRETTLSPTFPRGDGFVPGAALLLKAKQFDDGLYAAVELAAQDGTGPFIGKAVLLTRMAEALSQRAGGAEEALALILGACQPGGLLLPLPAGTRDRVQGKVETFRRNQLRSKPLGFYTWTPRLESIFHQDRLLQERLPPGIWRDLDAALDRSPETRAAYEQYRQLTSRLTNPPADPAPLDEGTEIPFFPPSRSHEVDLFHRLYGQKRIPNRFDLMEELVRRIASGKVQLAPTEDSGWYDYQTWSLEPLVVPQKMPEARHLQLEKGYRNHLVGLFKGMLALARETHIKQGPGGRGGYTGPCEPPVWVNPGLTVEPLPSLYRRRAFGYQFVRSVLEESFGEDALAGMHRLTPDGPLLLSLVEELKGMEALFTGAYLTACQELGTGVRLEEPGLRLTQGDEPFRQWASNLGPDPDLGRDARMMVPVFHDILRDRIKVWAFLGWETTPLDVQYATPPQVIGCNRSGRGPGSGSVGEAPMVLFSGERHEMATPVMVEVYVRRVLDRQEFQRHCDCHRTRSAILNNLG
jgi:hypothetical protein